MKIVFSTLITFICIALGAQTDTVYYFNKLDRACSSSEADYRVVVKKTGPKTFRHKTESINKKSDRSLDDELKINITGDSTYDVMRKTSYVKTCIFHRCDSGYFITDPDFNTISKGFSRSLFPLVKSGVWTVYNRSRKNKLSENTYVENELIHNVNWNEDGSPYLSDVFTYVETPPLFKNMDALEFNKKVLEEVRYPEFAVENGIMGKVYIQFVILKDGTLEGARVLRGVHPELDKEAIRALKSVKGKWTPATIRGNPVNAFMVMPVIFHLQE